MKNEKPKVVGQIYSTINYDRFRFREDNRTVKENNVTAKMESILNMGQRQPITVDQDYYVIDGQHRLEACRRLNIPVLFLVEQRMTSTTEIAELQSTSVKWNVADYTKSFSATGDENYKLYRRFSEKYPEFSHTCRILMLSNKSVRNKTDEQVFKSGSFQVKSYTKAVDIAEKLRELSQFYKGFNKRGFVCAMIHMLQHPHFDFSRLLRKMPKRCKEIMDFSRTEDYLDTLQDVYNWKETKKVYFGKDIAVSI